MDIQQLKYFLAVSHTGSYTKAAEQLYISRQAVRQSVRLLENELQAPLFARTKSGLKPTPLGETFAEEAERLVGEFDSFEYKMKQRAASQTVLLRVSIGAGVIMHLTADRFTRFQEQHPNILLSLNESDNQEVLHQLREGSIDVGLIGTSARYLTGFDSTLVIKNDLCIWCNTANPLSKKDYLSIEDLEGQPMVGHGEGYDLQRFYVEKCAEAGFEPTFSVISSDPQIAINLVEQNRSLCFGMMGLDQPDDPQQTSQSMRLLPLVTEEKDEWGIYAVTRGGTSRTALQELFINWLLEDVQQE